MNNIKLQISEKYHNKVKIQKKIKLLRSDLYSKPETIRGIHKPCEHGRGRRLDKMPIFSKMVNEGGSKCSKNYPYGLWIPPQKKLTGLTYYVSKFISKRNHNFFFDSLTIMHRIIYETVFIRYVRSISSVK